MTGPVKLATSRILTRMAQVRKSATPYPHTGSLRHLQQFRLLFNEASYHQERTNARQGITKRVLRARVKRHTPAHRRRCARGGAQASASGKSFLICFRLVKNRLLFVPVYVVSSTVLRKCTCRVRSGRPTGTKPVEVERTTEKTPETTAEIPIDEVRVATSLQQFEIPSRSELHRR